MEKTRECLRQDSRTIWEAMKQLDEKMVRQRKEPERRLVTYRLESASKAVVTTASALFLALIVSVWTNLQPVSHEPAFEGCRFEIPSHQDLSAGG